MAAVMSISAMGAATLSSKACIARRPAASFASARRPVLASRNFTVRAGDIIETAQENGFNSLVAAVEAAGLTSALKDPNSNFTVFAPTDQAFAAFGPLPSGDALTQQLKYHVLKGKTMSRHLPNYPNIATMEGTNLAIDAKTKKPDICVGSPPQGTQGLAGEVDGGQIIKADVEASNGVIHVIDAVMTPKAPLIGQNGGYVAGTEPGSGEGRTGLDVKVSSDSGSSSSW